MSPPPGGLPWPPNQNSLPPLQVIVHHIYFILSSKQLSLWNDFICLFIFFLFSSWDQGSYLLLPRQFQAVKTYLKMMCWMNEWINIQWIFHCLQMPRKWALVKIVMYSCRCRILHNCRRYTAPYVWHIQCTPYTAMCSNHGVLGPLGDGNWKAQIPKKVQRPQLQVPRSFPPGHVHWQDSTSLFVLTFFSVSSCVSSLHHSDTLILVIALSCSRLSSVPPAHISVNLMPFGFCHQLPSPLHIPNSDSPEGKSFRPQFSYLGGIFMLSLLTGCQAANGLATDTGLYALLNHLPPWGEKSTAQNRLHPGKGLHVG